MTKLQLSQAKFNHMTRLSNSDQVIAALAIDQRGALKRLLAAAAGGGEFGDDILIDFKKVISSDLTPYASSILLDAEYGVPASELRHADCGFIAAYEKNRLRCVYTRSFARPFAKLVSQTYQRIGGRCRKKSCFTMM